MGIKNRSSRWKNLFYLVGYAMPTGLFVPIAVAVSAFFVFVVFPFVVFVVFFVISVPLSHGFHLSLTLTLAQQSITPLAFAVCASVFLFLHSKRQVFKVSKKCRNALRSGAPGARLNETEEKRTRVFEAALEFRMRLCADEKRMSGKFAEFHQPGSVQPLMVS